MKWMPAGLGAEPKKVIALAVLLVAAPALYVYNSQPDIPPGSVAPRSSATSSPLPVKQPRPAARRPTVRVNEDFRPSLKLPDDYDLSSIDPTLKLDLLARVRSVEDVGGRRSLFEFYVPPPPPQVIKPINPAPVKPVEPPKPQVSTTPPKPQPPPIPFRFYGYSGTPRDGNLLALLVEGEETFVARVGDTIRNRWKIARISANAIEVEDITTKSTQPLQILPKCDDKDDTRCRQP